MDFAKKVLGIVTVQLAATFAMALYSSYYQNFAAFCRNFWTQLSSLFIYLASLITLLCSKKLRHSLPGNYLTLGVFTVSMALVVSGLTAYLTVTSVLLAVGVLVITLIFLFAAALFIPAKP